MNQKKLERIVKFLRENSVSHLKTAEFEISLSEPGKPFVASQATQSIPTLTGAAIPPVETAIPHHVNEVANLLKLSDEALVDKLFPVATTTTEGNA